MFSVRDISADLLFNLFSKEGILGSDLDLAVTVVTY